MTAERCPALHPSSGEQCELGDNVGQHDDRAPEGLHELLGGHKWPVTWPVTDEDRQRWAGQAPR